MDESKHKHDSCDFMDMINGMLSEFIQQFGKPPLSLCMGMSLAEHLWEHLRAQNIKDIGTKGSMIFKGVPIRILGYEDAVFAELEMGQIPQFRKLLKDQEAAAYAEFRRQMNENDTTNH